MDGDLWKLRGGSDRRADAERNGGLCLYGLCHGIHCHSVGFNDVSDDVVKGTVAMNLIKPIDYRMSLIAMASGNMAYRFLVPSVFIWIGLEFYKIKVLGLAPVTIAGIFLYLTSCLMSF